MDDFTISQFSLSLSLIGILNFLHKPWQSDCRYPIQNVLHLLFVIALIFATHKLFKE